MMVNVIRRLSIVKEKILISLGKISPIILEVILDAALFFIALTIIMCAIGIPMSVSHMKNSDILNYLMFLIIVLIYFFMAYDLRKILKSTKVTPFCYDNVKRFMRIGYLMFIAAVLEGIGKYGIKYNSGLQILSNGHGSVKGSFFIYLIVSFMCFVLAEVFKKAIKIKEENELTV